MRISDWSSDVCSSDLLFFDRLDDRQIAVDQEIEDGVEHIIGAVGEERGSGLELVAKIAVGALRSVADEIGRASCRERVCQYVYISVVGGPLKTKTVRHAEEERHIKK